MQEGFSPKKPLLQTWFLGRNKFSPGRGQAPGTALYYPKSTNYFRTSDIINLTNRRGSASLSGTENRLPHGQAAAVDRQTHNKQKAIPRGKPRIWISYKRAAGGPGKGVPYV